MENYVAEKMIPKEYIPLKKCFEKHGWQWEEDSETLRKVFANIYVKIKKDMYLYNYNNKVLVKRDHPIIMRCRGLIVNIDGKILNYPLDRFFNHFEKEVCKIDWNTTKIQEKVDGSLICVFWNIDKWEITTRGSFYPQEKAIKNNIDFAELFKKHFNDFNRLNKKHCYIFELCTKKNRIVKWYNNEKVYLLSSRNLETLKEVSEDIFINEINIKPLKLYDATNIKECIILFEKFKEDDEGLVIVDKDFNRIKIKQESYIKLAKIKMLRKQDLFDYILGNIEIDIEFLEKCPEVVIELNKMKKEWEKKKEKIEEIYKILINSTSRKNFALEAVKYPFKSTLFRLLDKGNIGKKYKWSQVEKWEIDT